LTGDFHGARVRGASAGKRLSMLTADNHKRALAQIIRNAGYDSDRGRCVTCARRFDIGTQVYSEAMNAAELHTAVK
jgi:hypothetical protein